MRGLAWRPQWATRNGRDRGSITTAASPPILIPRIQGHVRGWNGGARAVERQAASTSQPGRFEVELPATEENVSTSGGLCGAWIDRVHDRHPPKEIIRDMDSSVCPPHGDQEGSVHSPGNFMPTLALPKHVRRLSTGRGCRGAKPASEIPRRFDDSRPRPAPVWPGKSTAG